MPLVIGIDDTTADKTGKKIPAAGYFYNSKSPPFARSFKWALRFITMSALITPYGLIAEAKGILIKFKLAPVIKRPRKNAPADEHKQYEQLTTCPIFACGKWHDLKYKTVGNVLWQAVGCEHPLRLIIIAPLHYRLSRKSKLLYRRPAYLLVTGPNYPVHLAIQHYFYRWEIDVNHRDAKNNFGVGNAQVRHHRSVARQFNFAALLHSMLTLAGLDAYGPSCSDKYAPRPKWRNDHRSRPSALDLATQLRIELWSREAGAELIEFSADPVLAPNAPKYIENAQV